MEIDLEKIINQIDGCKLIGRLENKLLDYAVDNRHESDKFFENLVLLMYRFLDEFFADVDLSESYTRKLVMTHTEPLTNESMMALHNWFIGQSCNLNNIYLVCSGNVGIIEWYKQYLALRGEIGLNIIETPWVRDDVVLLWDQPYQPATVDTIRKDLKFYFSFYGGRTNSYQPMLEKDFNVALLLAKTSGGHIEYKAGFRTPDVEFDGYAEYMTNFADRKLVDQLLTIKRNSNFNPDNSIELPGAEYAHSFTGTQWEYDQQSACHVIRETFTTSTIPTVTEKTLRSFIHFLIPMPISGVGAIDHLKDLGFALDFDIIDYDYQYEPVHYKRMLKMIAQLNNLKKYKLSELEEYMLDKADMLCYNHNYVTSGDIIEKGKQHLIKELSK